MSKGQRLAIVASFLLLCIVIGFAFLKHPEKSEPQDNSAVKFSSTPSTNKTNSTPPSTEQLTDAIKSKSADPTLQSGDFTVVSSQEPVSGWYVMTISPAGGVSEDEVLILKGAGANLTIVAGPGTAFSADDLASKNVPRAVLSQVLVYDDSGN